MSGTLETRVLDLLDTVYDPCSIASNAPLGLVEMGLVRGVEPQSDGRVLIRLTVTGPGCMMAGNIGRAVISAVEAEIGEGRAEVRFETDFVWTPDAMSAGGAAKLAAARQRASAVRPQQWREVTPCHA